MRIAQVSHLTESIPPQRYGGSERVVFYLTEELVRLGHEVTLFASGDSTTSARLEPIWPSALRLTSRTCERDAALTLLLERAFSPAAECDIIHSHLDFLGFPLARRCSVPVLTTLHGRLDLPELREVYRRFAGVPLVSVSYAQREPCPWANWRGNVPHGLPRHLYSFHPGPGKYLAFLGRISPEKSPETAIRVATGVGVPLRIAAKVDQADTVYFQEAIRPLLAHPLVEYVGEITDKEKNDFLGDAVALLCPYGSEAFGLTLIEALACGTPVVTYRHGSFPEIIEDGTTGFLCRTPGEMAAAVGRVPDIDRARCRRAFEERFTVERMVRDYLLVYERLLAGGAAC